MCEALGLAEDVVEGEAGVAEHLFDGGDDGTEAVAIKGGEQAQGAAMALDVEDFVEHHRFAVDMRFTFFRAIDDGCRGAEAVHHGVFADKSGENIHPHHGGVDGRTGMNDGDVKQAVG